MTQPQSAPMAPLEATLSWLFEASFGARPTTLARAPGRVELLGNHTDYNQGLVLCAAIDRHTLVAGRAVPGRQAAVRSARFNQLDTFDIDAINPTEPGSWSRYVRGVCWALSDQSRPVPDGQGWTCDRLTSGFEAVIEGDVPLGAGLSSSASLQAALAVFLLAAGLVRPDPATGEAPRMGLAASLRRSENQFVGVGSGIMDQFASLFGQAGCALVLDCRDLSHRVVSLGEPAPCIVVCDSKTSRRLADGMYDRRRAECEQVVRQFQERGKATVRSLRDLTIEDLATAWNDLDPAARKRARHVLTENQRVEQGALALSRGDVTAFGRLMSASHASSRDDFENSSTALDALIEAAEGAPGYLGGKLSGAGWAGCTVNLVQADHAAAFAEAVRSRYTTATGTVPDVHICRAAAGAAVWK
jgi:galactokinase